MFLDNSYASGLNKALYKGCRRPFAAQRHNLTLFEQTNALSVRKKTNQIIRRFGLTAAANRLEKKWGSNV